MARACVSRACIWVFKVTAAARRLSSNCAMPSTIANNATAASPKFHHRQRLCWVPRCAGGNTLTPSSWPLAATKSTPAKPCAAPPKRAHVASNCARGSTTSSTCSWPSSRTCNSRPSYSTSAGANGVWRSISKPSTSRKRSRAAAGTTRLRRKPALSGNCNQCGRSRARSCNTRCKASRPAGSGKGRPANSCGPASPCSSRRTASPCGCSHRRWSPATTMRRSDTGNHAARLCPHQVSSPRSPEPDCASNVTPACCALTA